MFDPDRLSCFWPGLAQAWWRGSSTALVAAIGFGWSLSLLLLATFVWPNWFAPWLVTLCWLCMLAFWLGESIRNHWQLGKLQADAGPVVGDDRFATAQQEYLRGNWFEAETLLHAILTDTPRDPEAHLLLVGVLRHSRRWSAAFRRLEQLELLDTSSRWTFEIRRERQFISQRQQEYVATKTDAAASDDGELSTGAVQALDNAAVRVDDSAEAEKSVAASRQPFFALPHKPQKR